MFKGFCQGRSPEFLACNKRHARAPLLTTQVAEDLKAKADELVRSDYERCLQLCNGL